MKFLVDAQLPVRLARFIQEILEIVNRTTF